MKPVDVAAAGHFSLDYIKLPNRKAPCVVLGGAVAFASLAARQLGASAAVLSRVGSDFPESYIERLRNEDIDVSAVTKDAGDQTTSFELTYNEDFSKRTLKLKQMGSQINPADVPKKFNAKTIHVAPIAGELGYKVIKKLKMHCQCLSIDPQGMTRRFGKNGAVKQTREMDKRILPLIDIFKSSTEEIEVLTGEPDLEKAIQAVHKAGPETVIITQGAKGSILSNEHGQVRVHVPACISQRLVDPTGAGDVYIGAFLAEYVRKKAPSWCACVASAAASLIVEDVGSSFFGEKTETYRRARTIYAKLKKSG